MNANKHPYPLTVEQRKHLADEIAQTKLFARRSQSFLLRRTGAIFDARVRRRIEREPDMGAAFRNFVQHVVDRQDGEADIELRVLHAERRENLGDERIHVTLADGQIDAALLQSAQGLQLVLELLLLRAIAAPELQQMLRGLGGLDATRLARLRAA